MFGIGGGELFLIAFVALIVFGPQRIPELARNAARGYRELLRLRRQVDSTLEDVKRDLQLDRELQLGLDEPLSAAPVLRPPQGERASARASTVPGAAAAAGPPSALFAELPVPEEDDYLAPAAAPATGAGRDPEDYLGGPA